MKAKMRTTKSYSLVVGECALNGLTAVSHWNGLTELVTPDKQTLIVSGLSGAGAAMSEILGVCNDVTVLQASPELVAWMNKAEKDAMP